MNGAGTVTARGQRELHGCNIAATKWKTYGGSPMSKYLAAARRKLPITALVLMAAISALAHDANAQRKLPKSVSSPVTSSRVKGIWEAVNYDQDLNLTSVYFVTPKMGWAAGEHGTIIKTVDGGAHWTPQLGGDPVGAAAAISQLRFVDQRHGFAVQYNGGHDASLLRTVDGQTWRSGGTLPFIRGDYLFTTPTTGFTSTENEIRRTRDGGRTWQKVMDCRANMKVNGLSRNVVCEIESLSFPTPQIGYGTGRVGDVPGGVFMAKTTDGGDTWALWQVLDDESTHQGFIMFTEPNTGFACTYGGKFFSTADGGRNWDGVAGVDCGGASHGKFADPETGWILEAHRWNYTTDGGRTWASRVLNFPTAIEAFSFPRRDRAYAVGNHGMVYRYSVVPAEYTAANSIETPAVGVFSSPLDDQVEEFVADVEAFSAENGGPSTGASSGSATAFDPGSGSTGSSAAKAKRGGITLGKLQALLDVIGTSMPDFLARYRNLNLLFEGARTTAGMPTWLQTVKGGLAAFRSLADNSSAAAVLAQLVSASDNLKNQTQVAFMQTSFTQGPEDGASGFSSMPAPAATAVRVDSAATGAKSAVADSIANAAKDAAKKGLGGLLKNPFGKKH